MGDLRPSDGYHVVSARENLESIAFLYGFWAATIWDHPSNADLRKLRKDPCVLAEGDKVFIPQMRSRTETGETNLVHRFKVKNTPSLLRFRPLVFGDPLVKEKYLLIVDDAEPIEGVIGDDGTIKHFVRPDARVAKVIVGEGLGQITYTLELRTLYPSSEEVGIRMRLEQLGLFDDAFGSDKKAELKNAIGMFQERHGLEPTGIADSKTKELLLRQHGR